MDEDDRLWKALDEDPEGPALAAWLQLRGGARTPAVGLEGERFVAPLFTLLRDWARPHPTRSQALAHLGAIAQETPSLAPDIASRLRAFLDDPRFEESRDADDDTTWLCRQVGQVLGALPEHALPTLLEGVGAVGWTVQLPSAIGLAAVIRPWSRVSPADRSRALDAVLAALRRHRPEDAVVAFALLDAVGNAGAAATPAAEDISAWLRHPTYTSVVMAILQQLGTAGRAAVVARLPELDYEAQQIVDERFDADDVPALAAALRPDGAWQAARALQRLADRLPSEVARSQPQILRVLADPAVERTKDGVADILARTLQVVGDTDALPVLERLAADKSRTAKGAVLAIEKRAVPKTPRAPRGRKS